MNPIRKSCWALLAVAAFFVGCDTPAPPSPVVGPGPSEPASNPAAKPAEAEKKVDAKDVKLTDVEVAEIKKLPEAEQTAAMEQKLCPISGDHLGSMEVPIKVTLKDQAVYLCCAGCKKKAEAEPEATLAKLGKK